MNELREFTLRLSQVPGLGPVTFSKLIDEYDSLESLYLEFINKRLDTQLMRKILNVDLNELLQQVQKNDISYSCVWESDYPQLLEKVPDAPIILFYKGNLKPANQQHLISVVGSRKLTNEATKWTKDLVSNLVANGWGIVSGMAMGIDAIAHEVALSSEGFTLAVLPSPLNKPLPVTNEFLFNRILNNGGCVVSEYPPNIPTNKGMFAARNRIVAGISRATVVTLAGEESGSLITAACAFDYGREVFAFPGNTNQQSMKGCNKLIRTDKAKLVEGVGDVLSEFDQWAEKGINNNSNQVLAKKIEVEPELADIYGCLVNEALSVDDLVSKFDRSVADVISLLMRLQIKGLVKTQDNDKFVAVI